MNNKKDRELVKKIINRDEKSLISLYKNYRKPLLSFVNRQIKDQYKAEEIIQDTFIDFIEGLRDFHFQSSLKTFIFSIAKNKTIDYMRKKKLKKILFSALPPYFVESLRAVFIDDEIEKKELSAKIKNTLEKLPNDYRFVLRLKYIEGEKVGAISQKLNLRFKATESLLFRARKAFVKLFNKLV